MASTSKNVTLVVTEACNFACRYCYLHGKNTERRMPLEVATAAIDYLLAHPELFPEEEVVWDFMGGEPLLEVELIEEVIGYALRRCYELGHPWFEHATYSITSNGALYGTPRVERLLARYPRIEVQITVDGTPEMHDLERVFPDGRGTYGAVAANLPRWLARQPRASTKVTLSHRNLPFLAGSVLHLFGLGIRTVNANVVFEPGWAPGDNVILEEQLDRLGRAILDRGLHPTHRCSLFSPTIGRPLSRDDETNWCGPGKMLAIDAAGDFYPCNRFMPFSLVRRAGRTIGNIRDGIDLNRLRPFLALTRTSQSPAACVTCEVASGCAWCQGFNYDDAASPTIYQRAIHLCAMHKARVRANRRFWAEAGIPEGEA